MLFIWRTRAHTCTFFFRLFFLLISKSNYQYNFLLLNYDVLYLWSRPLVYMKRYKICTLLKDLKIQNRDVKCLFLIWCKDITLTYLCLYSQVTIFFQINWRIIIILLKYVLYFLDDIYIYIPKKIYYIANLVVRSFLDSLALITAMHLVCCEPFL